MPIFPRHLPAVLALLAAIAAEAAAQEPAAEPFRSPSLWRPLRPRAASELSAEELEHAAALGYLAGVQPAPSQTGLLRHDPDRACAGLNLYTSGHGPEALLVDMDGELIHRWAYSPEEVWPDFEEVPGADRLRHWRRVHLSPSGELLAIVEGVGMLALDRESRLLWSHRAGEHHDLSVDASGRIHVLTRQIHVLPRIHPEDPVVEDFVTVLQPDGTEVSRFSILECFENSDYRALLYRMRRSFDVFHTNSLQLLDGTLAERLPAFAAGNYLVSIRHLDALAVLDPKQQRVVWAQTGMWRRQHEPLVQPGGTLLLFDNLHTRMSSRVIEFDLLTQAIVWRYPKEPDGGRLFSEFMGSQQRLANGNTLITESDAGRVIEVTPGGEVVWEFLNPHRFVPVADPAAEEPPQELIAVISEMIRFAADSTVARAFGSGS